MCLPPFSIIISVWPWKSAQLLTMTPLDILMHSLLMKSLMVLTLVSWNYLEASCKTFGPLHSLLIDASVESVDANVVNLGGLLQNTWSTPHWWKYWECWHWSRRSYWSSVSNQLNLLADHSLMVTFSILILKWVILLVVCSKPLGHTDFHNHVESVDVSAGDLVGDLLQIIWTILLWQPWNYW